MKIYCKIAWNIDKKNTQKLSKSRKKELALSSGTGLRFIIDLEHGKPTCQLEKTLTVIRILGIKMQLDSPFVENHIE